MPWFKVDDQLHDHRKSRHAGRSAMGVWVLAGSWSMDNLTDGFIPAGVLPRWGTKADASRLVSADLWYADEHQGEQGWRFHDWHVFQPPVDVMAATKEKESKGGALGAHKQWHVKRGITKPDCEFCHPIPDEPPHEDPYGAPNGVEMGFGCPEPEPEPVPQVSPNGETSSSLAIPDRDDVQRICEHLADRIAEDGSKRPAIGKGWQDAARLMLDRDGRSEQEIHAAIDWCQSHHFWRSNVLSMPKLREKFDQLRKVAASEQQKPGGGTSRSDEWKSMQERQMQRALEREREMGIQ